MNLEQERDTIMIDKVFVNFLYLVNYHVNFIFLYMPSLAVGLLIGFVYLFLSIKAGNKINQEQEPIINFIEPKTYRTLLYFRIFITAIFLIIARMLFDLKPEWLLAGFVISFVGHLIVVIKGISWN